MSLRQISHFVVIVLTAWAALLDGPMLIASASAAPCPDVEVTFARASTEAPGVGVVGQKFIDALRSQVGGRSIGVYPVNYPASEDFVPSVNAGTSDASAHVQSMIADCPNTKMVLGGYSQGAMVIDQPEGHARSRHYQARPPVSAQGSRSPRPAAAHSRPGADFCARRRRELRRPPCSRRALPRCAESAARCRLRGGRARIGERVLAGTRFGGYAEIVNASADDTVALPESMSFEQGAAVPVNYATAWAALHGYGSLRAGERVLVQAQARSCTALLRRASTASSLRWASTAPSTTAAMGGGKTQNRTTSCWTRTNDHERAPAHQRA